MQSLIYSLLNFLNTTLQQDTNYQIASCLLQHLYEIPHLSLQEAADVCHVSIATFNRFCKTLGYKNYSTLRKIASYGQPKTYAATHNPNFLNLLIDNMQMIENIHLSTLDKVVDKLYHAKKIILAGYGDFQFEALYFQKHLFSHGKYAKVLSNPNGDDQAFQSLEENDVLLITSMQLNYLQLNQSPKAKERIKNLKCQKIAITQIQNEDLLAIFDAYLPCGIHSDKEVQSYGMLRIYDLIINRYHEKYYPEVFE